jgi:hypothetical protein
MGSMTVTCAALVCLGCKVKEPPAIREPFADKFERADLGQNYFATGAGYQIAQGALSAKGAKNHPLWLKRKLPRDVRIEFDAWSTDRRGDIKVEVFGDGRSFDADGGAYLATGYGLIFGGWSNSKSMIARLDEHGSDNATRTDIRVVANKRYHWKIERKGKVITWWITDAEDAQAAAAAPFLKYEDANPLAGPGHEFLAFNNWETDTWFDNLVVTPL